MTDKEIIQALNTATNIDGLQICCIDYENNPKNAKYLSIKSDILDLINRQQEELEEARIGVKSYKGKYESAVKTAKELQTLVDEQQAENKELKTENLILSQKRFNIFERIEFADKLKKQTKAEAIKEVFDKIKAVNRWSCIDIRYFDKVEKEMVGDDK